MSKQAIFDLNEENLIEFKMSVKGSTNLPNIKPLIRFIISENKADGFAVVLPAQATEEGVSVAIPPLKNVFSHEKDYVGKLEIIIGNRYFSPSSMNIGFSNPIDIEIEPIVKVADPVYKVEATKISGELKTESKITTKATNAKFSTSKSATVKDEIEKKFYDDSDLTDEIMEALQLKETPKVKSLNNNQFNGSHPPKPSPTNISEFKKQTDQSSFKNSDPKESSLSKTNKEKITLLLKDALK
jgi:hypothetical protein